MSISKISFFSFAISIAVSIVAKYGTWLSLRLEQNIKWALLVIALALLGAGVCGQGGAGGCSGKGEPSEPTSADQKISATREEGFWNYLSEVAIVLMIVLTLGCLFSALIIYAVMRPPTYKVGIRAATFIISAIAVTAVYLLKREHFNSFPQTVSFFALSMVPPTAIGWFL